MSQFDRFSGILDLEQIATTPVTVIGAGAIGRQVCLQLAGIGVRELEVYDHDGVEEVNVGPQGYWTTEIGMKKVMALKDHLLCVNPEMNLVAVDQKFDRYSSADGRVVFVCVDRIEVREDFYNWNHQWKCCPLVLDGRMGAENFRLITLSDERTKAAYSSALFPAHEQEPMPCTQKATIYNASFLAALMVNQFTHWLRGYDLYSDMLGSLLSIEIQKGQVYES